MFKISTFKISKFKISKFKISIFKMSTFKIANVQDFFKVLNSLFQPQALLSGTGAAGSACKGGAEEPGQPRHRRHRLQPSVLGTWKAKMDDPLAQRRGGGAALQLKDNSCWLV